MQVNIVNSGLDLYSSARSVATRSIITFVSSRAIERNTSWAISNFDLRGSKCIASISSMVLILQTYRTYMDTDRRHVVLFANLTSSYQTLHLKHRLITEVLPPSC